MSIIYKTTSPTGKIYIGQKSKHKGKPINSLEDLLQTSYYGSSKKLNEDVKLFGKENFKRELIEEGIQTQEDLNKRESFWIEYFNARNPNIGYNISKQAYPFFTDCHHTEESKKIMSKKKKGKQFSIEHKQKIRETNKGKHQSAETIQKRVEKHNKSVYQYDLKGNFIKEYKSVIKAAEKNNLYHSNISTCCRNKQKTSGGFIWKFEKFQKINPSPILQTHCKLVYQYDLEGNFIREYKSVRVAGKINNIWGVGACCRNKQKTSGGFIWKFEKF